MDARQERLVCLATQELQALLDISSIRMLRQDFSKETPLIPLIPFTILAEIILRQKAKYYRQQVKRFQANGPDDLH